MFNRNLVVMNLIPIDDASNNNKGIFVVDQAPIIIKTFENTANTNTARLPVSNSKTIKSTAEIMSTAFSLSLFNAVSSPMSKNNAKVLGY